MISTNGLTQDSIPSLVLKEPKLLTVNKVEYAAFDSEGYETILKLYVFYETYQEISKLKDKELNLCNQEVKVLENKNKLKDLSIKTLKDDRELAYGQINTLIQRAEKEERKNNIKIGLWTGGSLVVGVGLGVLIGFFAK